VAIAICGKFKKASFFRALPASIAISPVGILFGLLAYSIDWDILQVGILSLIAFTGSGQFAIIPLLQEQNSDLLTIGMVLISINMRYIPMSYFDKDNLPNKSIPRLLMSHFLGDEAYAVENKEDNVMDRIIIRFTIVFFWVFSTMLGVYLGKYSLVFLPNSINLYFPASILLACLSYDQIKSGLKNSYDNITGKFYALIICFIVSLSSILIIGDKYFWIPSIISSAIVLAIISRKYNDSR